MGENLELYYACPNCGKMPSVGNGINPYDLPVFAYKCNKCKTRHIGEVRLYQIDKIIWQEQNIGLIKYWHKKLTL